MTLLENWPSIQIVKLFSLASVILLQIIIGIIPTPISLVQMLRNLLGLMHGEGGRCRMMTRELDGMPNDDRRRRGVWLTPKQYNVIFECSLIGITATLCAVIFWPRSRGLYSCDANSDQSQAMLQNNSDSNWLGLTKGIWEPSQEYKLGCLRTFIVKVHLMKLWIK